MFSQQILPGIAQPAARRRLRTPVALLAGIALGGGALSAAAGTSPLTTVAYSGQPAHGQGLGISYFSFGFPSMSTDGHVGYFTFITAPASSDAVLMTRDMSNSTYNILAREGFSVLGETNVFYGNSTDASPFTFFSTLMSPGGKGAFFSRFIGGGAPIGSDSGIVSGAPGDVRMHIRRNAPAPGIPGATAGAVAIRCWQSDVLAAGIIVSQAGAGAGSAIVSGPRDDLQIVARTDDLIPGAGARFALINNWADGFSPAEMRMNESGVLGFLATLAPSTGSFADGGLSVLRGEPGNVEIVARYEQALPGGFTNDFPTSVRIDDDGRVYFHTYDFSVFEPHLFAGAPGDLERLIGVGDTIDGDTVAWFEDNAWTSSGDGRVAVAAQTFFNSKCMVRENGEWSVAFQDGDMIGDIGQIGFDFVFFPITMNRAGQIVFRCFVDLLDDPFFASDALIGWTPGVGLELIAYPGGQIEVAPGDVRTISSIVFVNDNPSQTTQNTGLSDLGQVAFRASFVGGGAGIFVHTLQSPPAPPSCPADLTGDGAVGSADLSTLLGCWGVVDGACAVADLDNNGLVGSSDLSALLGSWGPCP